MISIDQAKEKVLRDWDRWIGRQPSTHKPERRDALKFFFELQAKRSPALDFDAGSIDRWLIVHSWLLASGRVLD